MFDRTFITVSKCPLGTIFVFVKVRILLLCYLYLRFLVTFDNNLLEQRCTIVNVQCLVSIMVQRFVVCRKLYHAHAKGQFLELNFLLYVHPECGGQTDRNCLSKYVLPYCQIFTFQFIFLRCKNPSCYNKLCVFFFLLEGQNYLQISRPLDRT